VRRVETIQPSKEGSAAYESLYPTFRGLYDALKPSYHALARFEGVG
jgi:sugar (pentulose or hexulose) kinase